MTVHYLPSARPDPAARAWRSETPPREPRPRSYGIRRYGRSHEDGIATADAQDDNTAWLLTFSDLVILLFGFVVLSVAMTRSAPAARANVVDTAPIVPARSAPVDVPEPRVDVARTVIDVAPVIPAHGNEPDAPPIVAAEVVDVAAAAPAASPPEDEAEGGRFVALGRYLEAFGTASGIGEAITVAADESGVELALGSDLGFASGRAELATSALPLLREVGALLGGMPDVVLEVSGHTDAAPVHSRTYSSNLELSLARAARVARAIAGDDDALAARIATAGFADHRAIAPNALASDRARNRRVELRLVPR
jgi:chemotaxis protein MotB